MSQNASISSHLVISWRATSGTGRAVAWAENRRKSKAKPMNSMLAEALRGVLRPGQDADKRPPTRKPSSLVYAVGDVPPPLVTLLNGAQHVGVIAINLVYPVLIFRAAGTPVEVVSS